MTALDRGLSHRILIYKDPVVFSEYGSRFAFASVSKCTDYCGRKKRQLKMLWYLMMVQSAIWMRQSSGRNLWSGHEENFANLDEWTGSGNLVVKIPIWLMLRALVWKIISSHRRDLALIIKRAMSHDMFRKLVTRRGLLFRTQSNILIQHRTTGYK